MVVGIENTAGAPVDPLALIRDSVPLRNPNALTQTVLSLISRGALVPGTKLPTVRAMADALGMSPSGVSQAWSALAARKAVETRRRAGTVVRGLPEPPSAERYLSLLTTTTDAQLDLGSLRGDSLGRPPLAAAFSQAAGHASINLQHPDQICPELVAVLEPGWPSVPQAWLALNGVPDLIELFLSVTVRRGDHVLVEAPTYPRVLDIIESLGGIAVGIPWADAGPDLVALSRAMATSPVAMVIQPAVSAPLGRTYTADWLDEALPILRPLDFPILETSLITWFESPTRTLGTLLPDRVVRGESMVFMYGQDLRVCPVAGSARVIDRLWRQLSYSSRLVSRVNQLALAYLRSDEACLAQCAQAVAESDARSAAFGAALRAEGFSYEAGRGPGMWLSVANEEQFISRLRADGIAVAPGRSCFPPRIRPMDNPGRVYLNAAPIPVPDADAIARRFAQADGRRTV